MIHRLFPVPALVALVLSSGTSSPPTTVQVVSGSRPDGSATPLWLTLLRRRLPDPVYDSVARIRHPRTAGEEAWARSAEEAARSWPAQADSLARIFDGLRVPSVTVVLGNRGGEDAFTHDSLVIGFDLAALDRLYGDAGSTENRDRIHRFFRHEFMHVLQKRWLARHPFLVGSYQDAAILDAWAEGLGNYFSLSSKWRPTESGPSPETSRTLAELEPRLVERLSALACADSVSAPALMAGLSSGPFTQKWGALPVALWLLAEETTQPGALRRLAVGGPEEVWSLARRHLSPALADSLEAARRRSQGCVLRQ